MIITIDGPAGAGKSTVARLLAQRLGFEFLDTGAMYRAVALAGLRKGIDPADTDALAATAEATKMDFCDGRLILAGDDVSDAIRTAEVTAATRFAADNRRVRQLLIERQRQAARGRNIVTEGRDQGSLVFPQAELKVFLTASEEERARRRCAQLQASGQAANFDDVLAAQRRRDAEDRARDFGGLVAPADAFVVQTDGLTIDQVVDQIMSELANRGFIPR